MPFDENDTEVKIISRSDIHLLDECFLGFITHEPFHSANYDLDVVKYREYYLKVYYDKLFSDDCPQFALWNHKKQKVEGMILTFLYTKSKEVVFPTYFVDSPVTPQTEKLMNIMYRRFDELNAKYADPKRYGVDKVVFFHNLFTFEKDRSRGKGAKLISSAIEICREQLGAQVFAAICSNPHSYRACIKLGFELVEEITYEQAGFPISLMHKEFLEKYDRIWVVVKGLTKTKTSKL